MTVVAILREAAALMRTTAEAATPGPWEARTLGCHPWVALYADEDTIPEGESLPTMETGGSATTADIVHIAGMHPAVALAVADWLDATAETMSTAQWRLYSETHWHPQDRAALAVARAYLGLTTEGDPVTDPVTHQPWPENAMPTPEQLADWLPTIDRDQRVAFAEKALRDQETSARCFTENHDARLTEENR